MITNHKLVTKALQLYILFTIENYVYNNINDFFVKLYTKKDIKKLQANVDKSKVMICSRHANVGRMNLRPNDEPLEEAVCFKYLESQVAANGGCDTWNE